MISRLKGLRSAQGSGGLTGAFEQEQMKAPKQMNKTCFIRRQVMVSDPSKNATYFPTEGSARINHRNKPGQLKQKGYIQINLQYPSVSHPIPV
jgi:hypothetical protein